MQIPEKGECLAGSRRAGYNCRRDETGIPVWQICEVINQSNIDKKTLAELSRVGERTLASITSKTHKQALVTLTIADKILLGIGCEYSVNAFAVLPMKDDDALSMAIYESLDDNDVVQKSSEEIHNRAIELLDLKELILSDSEEEREVGVQILQKLI